MVPEEPTLINNSVEVVVEPSSLLLLQEMKVELKRRIERMMSRCFTEFPYKWFRRTQYITPIGLFYKNMGRLWSCV